MKKGLFALVVLGAIAGTVAYKLIKNQKEKELLDEELEILSSVEVEEDSEETSEEESEEPDEIETNEEENSEELEETEELDEEITEYDFSEKSQDLEESNEEELKEFNEVESQEANDCEFEEKITEYDFSDKVEEVVEENTTEEFISEEILENPFIEKNNGDYKEESNVDEEFIESNNPFEEECPIQHTIDFKSAIDMEAYKLVVIEKGYVVTRGESPYQLSVLHIAPNNKSELLANVYYLANQAIKHNGSYQGWQSRKVL